MGNKAVRTRVISNFLPASPLSFLVEAGREHQRSQSHKHRDTAMDSTLQIKLVTTSATQEQIVLDFLRIL